MKSFSGKCRSFWTT